MENPELYVVVSGCPTYSTPDGGHHCCVVPPEAAVPVPLYSEMSPVRAITHSAGQYPCQAPRLVVGMSIICVARGTVEITDSVLSRHIFIAPTAFLVDAAAGVLLQRDQSADAIVVEIDLALGSTLTSPKLVTAVSAAGNIGQFRWPELPIVVDVISFGANTAVSLGASDLPTCSVECTVFGSGSGSVSAGSTEEQFYSGTVVYRNINPQSPDLTIQCRDVSYGVRVAFGSIEGRLRRSSIKPPEKVGYHKGQYFKPISCVDV
jgi:hypothetical protein